MNTRPRKPPAPLVAALALAGGSGCLFGYTYLSYHWSAQAAASGIVMHLQLGSSSGQLHDGSASWGKVAESALATWNAYLTNARFLVVRDSTIPIVANDGKNSVFFSSTVFGDSFGETTLAVTTSWTQSGHRIEADVVFNTAKSWNSYRGDRWNGVSDFRRVALHEFGHVLGLDHPDEAGQSVTAIMNSNIGNIDSLRADDIAGARALWWTRRITDLRILDRPRATGRMINPKRARVVCGVRNHSSWRSGAGSGLTSGTLKVVLWFSKKAYPARGYRVAEAFADLEANQSRVFRYTSRAKLPRKGRYRKTVVLEEYTAAGWRSKDWHSDGFVKIRR